MHFKKYFNFLEKFWVHSKSGQKVQSSHIAPAPSHAYVASPIINIP